MSSALRALSLAAVLLIAACGADDATPASTESSQTTNSPDQTTAPPTTEPPTTVQASDADFLLGGEFADNNYEALFLNVLECPAGNHTQFFGFGSTTFEVLGVRGEQCVFNHGTEIENPEWNGAITHACAIDTQQTIELAVTDDGINLETFEESCVQI